MLMTRFAYLSATVITIALNGAAVVALLPIFGASRNLCRGNPDHQSHKLAAGYRDCLPGGTDHWGRVLSQGSGCSRQRT